MKKAFENTTKKEIKYIGFYDRPDSLYKRASALSATNKMDYICDAMQRAGYDVHLISPSWFTDKNAGWTKQATFQLGAHKKLTLCPSFGTSNRWTQYIKIIFSLIWLLFFLLAHTRDGETILIYNATWLSLPVRIAKLIKRFRFILEIEEINSDVWDMKEFFRRQEQKLITSTDSYIVASDILAEKLPHENIIILYGAYSDNSDTFSQKPAKFNNKFINLVFAGEIENTRCGAYTAVQCTKLLSKEYLVHILGYGNEVDIKRLNSEIAEVNMYLGRQACIYHGTLIGSQFSDFLHNCDIAINSQKEGSYMETAFPSKILSYLSHDLRVVSTRINSIQKSKLSSLIHFSANDSPEAIAQTIRSIDLAETFDSRLIIGRLDEEFLVNIKTLLEG